MSVTDLKDFKYTLKISYLRLDILNCLGEVGFLLALKLVLLAIGMGRVVEEDY